MKSFKPFFLLFSRLLSVFLSPFLVAPRSSPEAVLVVYYSYPPTSWFSSTPPPSKSWDPSKFSTSSVSSGVPTTRRWLS